MATLGPGERLVAMNAGKHAPNYEKTYPPEPLTPAEAAAVLAQCSLKAPEGIRNRALLMLYARSGLRVSEALALRPSDVDFGEHTLRVLHGKGDKATVRGFHPSVDDALARWMETRKKFGIRNGPLFCTLDQRINPAVQPGRKPGRKLNPQYVRNLCHRLAEKAGIEKRVHPHGLRHTFAYQLLRAGVSVDVISKLLGHSSIAVTVRYLAHLSNDEAIRELEGVELPPLEG